MTRSTTSLRLDDKLRARLAERAEIEGTTVTGLVERLLREGLDTAEHPGIVFNSGPSGRRATLVGGPDAWEVISTLRRMSGSEAQRVNAAAAELGIHEREVVIALNYAAANAAEIEARIGANDRALDEAERIAAQRKRLLTPPRPST